MKTLYFDCETTGLNSVKNDIIQIAGIIEIDGKEVENFNIKIQPFSWENIEQRALDVNNITIKQLKEFQEPNIAYQELISLFSKYIDKFDREDKFIVCGYNVRFDIDFLKEFFIKNNNDYLFSYLGRIKDPMHIIDYLRTLNKVDVKSSKLIDVCDYFDIDIVNAHDAMADIIATKRIMEKLDNLFRDIIIKI